MLKKEFGIVLEQRIFITVITKQVGLHGNAPDFYSGGVLLESRLGLRLPQAFTGSLIAVQVK
jgi:hypothetical protein